MTDPHELFGVVQFFTDGSYEYVCHCEAREAVEVAKRLTENVGARIGTTRRVIITDDGDSTCFEWQFGRGVTFPPMKEVR